MTDSGATELPGTICPKCGAKVMNQMKKRKFTLDRDNDKRICECGGELKFLGVDYGFKPHTHCMKCGKEHVGIEGTKRENNAD